MTVIDGLSGASGHASRAQVLVSTGTYADRYGSADVIEYDPGPPLHARAEKLDAVLARAGLGRPYRGKEYRRAMLALPSQAHTLLLHNAPFTASIAPPRAAPVLYAHNQVLPGPRLAAMRGARDFEGVVTVSTWLAGQLEGRLPRRLRGRLARVVNGVDTDTFRFSERQERETVRILFLGRVVPDKGPDLVIEALGRANLKRVEVRIVGSAGFARSGPLSSFEQLLRRRAAALDVTVDFVPFAIRQEVAAHYAWADVVALPARVDDPCPLTLLEAMASGAATIISDSGGMPEAAAGAAMVVPRGEVDGLADALAHLCTDVVRRRRLGVLARRRAEELDWSSRAAELDQVLRGWGLPGSAPGQQVPGSLHPRDPYRRD
jgi:glycosyltransferase involved in cell wall biosynthesis